MKKYLFAILALLLISSGPVSAQIYGGINNSLFYLTNGYINSISTFGLAIKGNLGVGTTTATQRLTLDGATSSIAIWDKTYNSPGYLITAMSGNLFIGTTSSATATSSIPSIMINPNGVVGIGVGGFPSLPSAVNTIGGLYAPNAYVAGTMFQNALVAGATSGSVARANFYTGSDSTIGVLVKGNSVNQSADMFQVNNSASASLLDVTAAGKVGIGTSTPTALMHLSNSIAAASTTLAVGSAYNSKPANLCLWNGTSYTMIFFLPGGVAPQYIATSTCP